MREDVEVEDAAAGPWPAPAREHGGPGGAAEAPSAGGWRVLVVDDHATIRRIVRHLLRQGTGFHVVGEAEDGEEAVRLASTLRPDLVLLDLSLPRMDGLEALARIKDLTPETRVAVFSGLPRERVGDLTARLGADAYVEKGVTPDELRALLARVAAGPSAAPVAPVQERDLLEERLRELV